MRFWGVFFVVVLLFPELGRVNSARVSEFSNCPVVSITDSILLFGDSTCCTYYSYDFAVIERIAATLDVEIKRCTAGKDGNLRALLKSLQYCVLWPECGWTPVSSTDLITGAAVKKVYRKATLCIHPDKVMQKGATLQEQYVGEKLFDMLKEAWNKFKSEELFYD